MYYIITVSNSMCKGVYGVIFIPRCIYGTVNEVLRSGNLWYQKTRSSTFLRFVTSVRSPARKRTCACSRATRDLRTSVASLSFFRYHDYPSLRIHFRRLYAAGFFKLSAASYPRYMNKAGSTYKPETHTQSTYRFTKLLNSVVSEARMPS